MGLVNAVVEPDQLLPAARSWPPAWRPARPRPTPRSASRWPSPPRPPWPQALEKEAELQAAMGRTEDHRNATAAFVAKQKPVFRGR